MACLVGVVVDVVVGVVVDVFVGVVVDVFVGVVVGVVVEHMLAEEWPWHGLSQVTAAELWHGILSLSRQN